MKERLWKIELKNQRQTREVNSLSEKVKNPVNLNWKEVYKNAIESFINHPSEKEKRKVRMILSRLIDKVEFRKKPFSVKVFYRTTH